MSQTIEQASRAAGIHAYTFSDSLADAVMLPADFAAEARNSGISVMPVAVAIGSDGGMAFAAPAQSTGNLAAGTVVAHTAGGDGTDAGTSMPDAMHNGMSGLDGAHIFTSADIFTSALVIDTSSLDDAVGHPQASAANGETVVFNVDCYDNGSYAEAADVLEVFQGGSNDPGGDLLVSIHDTAAAMSGLSNIAAADAMKIV